MINNGSARGQSANDTKAPAKHLLARENEAVDVFEIRGVVADALPEAMEVMRFVARGSRAYRDVYHASVNLDRLKAPTMGRTQWLEAVEEVEHRLGRKDHHRDVIQHVKRREEHLHIAQYRVHPQTLRLARDSQNHGAVAVPSKSGGVSTPVVGVHTKLLRQSLFGSLPFVGPCDTVIHQPATLTGRMESNHDLTRARPDRRCPAYCRPRKR